MPQSDDTRSKLIDAAVKLFGERGFSGTTTRVVADAANANIGSIAYYFGNKQGLYLETVHHIASRVREAFGADDMGLTPAQALALDSASAHGYLQEFLKRLVRLFAQHDEGQYWLLLMVREQIRPTEAYWILVNEAFSLCQDLTNSLLAAYLGESEVNEKVMVQSHLLVGQAAFLLVNRLGLAQQVSQSRHLPESTICLAETLLLKHLDQLAPNSPG